MVQSKTHKVLPYHVARSISEIDLTTSVVLPLLKHPVSHADKLQWEQLHLPVQPRHQSGSFFTLYIIQKSSQRPRNTAQWSGRKLSRRLKQCSDTQLNISHRVLFGQSTKLNEAYGAAALSIEVIHPQRCCPVFDSRPWGLRRISFPCLLSKHFNQRPLVPETPFEKRRTWINSGPTKKQPSI